MFSIKLKDLLIKKQTPFAKNDPNNPPLKTEKYKESVILDIIPSDNNVMNEIEIDAIEDKSNNVSEHADIEIHSEVAIAFPISDNIDNTKSNKLEANFYKCTYCNKTFTHKKKLIPHEHKHASNFVISEFLQYFLCQKCNVMFLSEELLNNHEITYSHHKEQYMDDCTDYQFLDDHKLSSNSEPNELLYRCSICDVTDPVEINMKRHIISHADKLNCPFENCGSEYSCFPRLNIHIINKHLQNHEFKCLHCYDKSFDTFDELQNHTKNDCKERKFECSHCSM